jgi:hypothetical protein
MPPPNRNMQLEIGLTVTGTQNPDNSFTLTPTYTQGDTTPTTANVVDSFGDIDLTLFQDPNNQYSPATDIKFWLNHSNVTDKNGNLLRVTFSNPPAKFGPGNTTEFVNLGSMGSQWGCIFTDLDNQSGNYTYCLQLSMGAGFPSVPLDPQIINKPNK